MKRIAALALFAFATSAHADTIKLNTEDYRPFNFRDGKEYKGVGVEQVNLLMKDAGLDFSMEMMPWARALNLATTQSNNCVFTAVHNAERHPKFKWIEPLLKNRTVLVRKAGSGVTPATVDDAKAYVVGTQRDDYTQDILEAHHFPKIDLAANQKLTLKKLLSGRIDLMPVSEDYYEGLKSEGSPIEIAVVLAEDIYSIACNKSISDETVSKMQTSLNKLIADGTQAELFKKYGLSGN